MDGIRFDNWTRKLSRRNAIATIGASGAAAAVAKALPASAQTGSVTCQMALQALTSAGPSFGAAYTGVLEITLAEDGVIDAGSLAFDGGPSVPVVGQADGRALSLRATFPNGNALVLTGTGDNDIETCSGALSGVFGGPELGDTGSWIIDPTRSERVSTGTGGAGTATTVAGATVTPACPDVQCDSAYVVDPATCECVCPTPTVACGALCCPGGSVCEDESTGQCSCPVGTELCIDTCEPVCEMGYHRNYDSCECVQDCTNTCPPGQVVDENTCECIDGCSGNTPYECGGNCYADPFYECSGVCYSSVDLNSDANMCGPSCTVCPDGVPCIGGSCQCPATYDYCEGIGCVSLSDDDANCGSCGNACSGGQTCQGGMCQA